MTIDPTDPEQTTRPPANARLALKNALRAKKQRVAPIIVQLENELHTFTLVGWQQYCAERANHRHSSFQANDGRLLGPLYANITAWSDEHFGTHLKHLQLLELEAAGFTEPTATTNRLPLELPLPKPEPHNDD